MTKESKRQYKVHVAYVNANGTIIPAGIHEEGTFDLGEARYKSIVTMLDVEVKQTTTKVDEMPVHKFNESSTELTSVDMTAEVKTIKHDFLKINSADVNTITALKYVSKKNAEDVVRLRAAQSFESYADLNARVPLKFNRVWEDITPIDFEQVVGHKTDNSIYLSEGIVPLN